MNFSGAPPITDIIPNQTAKKNDTPKTEENKKNAKSGKKSQKNNKTNAADKKQTSVSAESIKEEESEDEGTMPMEKMRTLLALLLKKISTPGRLKKLGFGTRLIDDVLKESISGKNKLVKILCSYFLH